MTIYVVDVNDNAPSFVNLPYSVDIAEVRHVTWSRGGPWGGGGVTKGASVVVQNRQWVGTMDIQTKITFCGDGGC